MSESVSTYTTVHIRDGAKTHISDTKLPDIVKRVCFVTEGYADDGPTFYFTEAAWRDFVAAVRAAEVPEEVDATWETPQKKWTRLGYR